MKLNKLYLFMIGVGLTLVLMSCQNITVGPKTDAKPVIETRIALYWENTTAPHPERASWSDELISNLSSDLKTFAAAKDITDLCPPFNSLPPPDQLKALGEVFVSLAYYESGFKPSTASIDVGTQADRGSWSVGLFQVSANDMASRQLGFDYEQLLMPLPNIKAAVLTMKLQILRTGLFILPNESKARYWSTLLTGNKHSKIPAIKARIFKNAPKCNELPI